MSNEQTNNKHSWRNLPFIGDYLWQNYLNRQHLNHAHRNQDPKQLAEMAIPENEKLELHCCWVSEVYTPSHVSKLINSLRRLGWDTRSFGDSLSESILRQRASGGLTSWINAGIIVPKGSSIFVHPSNPIHSDLPIGVQYIDMYVYCLAPSITILTWQFVFDNTVSNRLTSAFSVEHKTRISSETKWSSGSSVTSFTGVRQQKQEYIEGFFDSLHEDLYNWVRGRVPGYFSNSMEHTFPTVNFLTSQIYELTNEFEYNNYLNILFGRASDRWQSSNLSSLEIRSDSNWFTEKPKEYLHLFGNYDAICNSISSTAGNVEGNRFLVDYMNSMLSQNMILWAIHRLLISYENTMSKIRDDVATIPLDMKKSIQNLEFIQKQFLSTSSDIQNVCNDLDNITKTPSFLGKVSDFTRLDTNDNVPFFETVLYKNQRIIERLRYLLPQVRETVITHGNLVSALSNLRLQRYGFGLTIILTILSIISFWDDIQRFVQVLLKL